MSSDLHTCATGICAAHAHTKISKKCENSLKCAPPLHCKLLLKWMVSRCCLGLAAGRRGKRLEQVKHASYRKCPAFGFEWSVGDKVCTVRGVAPPITGRQTERKIKSRDVLSEHSESVFITCLLLWWYVEGFRLRCNCLVFWECVNLLILCKWTLTW